MVQKSQNDCISCVAALVASVYYPCADCSRSWVHRWSCFDVIELLLSGLFVVPVVSVILRGIYVFCLFMVGCASLCGWWGMRMGGGGCYRVARWKTVIRSCSMFSLLRQRIRHEGDPSSGNGLLGRSQLTCSRQLQFRTRFERLDHVGWSPGAISVMLVCDRQYVVNEQGVRMCPGPAWFLG